MLKVGLFVAETRAHIIKGREVAIAPEVHSTTGNRAAYTKLGILSTFPEIPLLQEL